MFHQDFTKEQENYNMVNFSELKAGNVLGESQYYKVVKKVGDEIQLNANGQNIVVDKKYVEEFLESGDQFTSEENITKTQMAEIFIANPRAVMTVEFFKQDKKKTKKAYKEDLQDQADQVQKDFMAKGVSAIVDALANPVLDYIPGELRVMRGRHYGDIDELGRIKFTDMDIDGAHNTRQVDPRTLQSVVVGGKKYILKK